MPRKKLAWINETRKLSELIPWEHNPRLIKEQEAKRLLESLDEFGQIQTLAIGPGNEVYDGHQRKMVWGLAAKYGEDLEVDVRDDQGKKKAKIKGAPVDRIGEED